MTTTTTATKEENSRITLSEFIAKHGISMTAKPTDQNRNMEGSENMDHWLCTLKAPGAVINGKERRNTMRITFSMGSGHHGKAPSAEDVLECLALDAGGIENGRGSFEDWASEYGYDTDSRKAFRIFRATQRQTEKLSRFLTPDQYQELLWNTESL